MPPLKVGGLFMKIVYLFLRNYGQCPPKITLYPYHRVELRALSLYTCTIRF